LYKAESVLKINLKTPKVTDNKEIKVVWKRFTNASSKNIRISSPMVQSEALTLAKSLRNNQLKVSTAWLDSFKRHNTVWNGVCGESKHVDESVVSEYKPNMLEELISPYEPKNIYNADETGLFFGYYQQNHSQLREKSVPGAKCPKKDLQCYCAGLWWEKWKSLS
jgi:hypothetical protein